MKEKIKKIIQKTALELEEVKEFPKFSIPHFDIFFPKEKNFGDFSTNLAFVIGKIIKKDPFAIAQRIAEILLSKNLKIFEKVESVKPGYLNFFLSEKFLFDSLKKILKEKENFGKGKKKRETVLIDYSSPNIAKKFGIGHLRSTIIGKALYNLYKFLGYRVIGLNYLGDWGTQFGNLIYQIQKERLKPHSLTIDEMEKLYVKFHSEADKTPKILEEGKKWFKKLEEGDKEALKIWRICREKSLKEFERIYKLLDVKFDVVFGESFFEKDAKRLIEILRKKKFVKENEGAIIVEFEKENLPSQILLKSDGTTTYFLRDLASLKYRIKRWRPKLIIYQVGADQKLHFQQLFALAKRLNFVKNTTLYHSVHGLIRTEKGKLSTRMGRIIHLEKVLNEGIERAKKLIKSEKVKGKKEKEKIAKAVALGAIKYNDLKQHPSKDIIFSWQKILTLKGNSGPYLQYTFLRIKSVLKKSGFNQKIKPTNLNDKEKEILKHLIIFPDVVEEGAKKFSPNIVSEYAFELCQKFNLFYEKNPILRGGEKRNLRVGLTLAVSYVLKNCLRLLGIPIPKKM